MHLDETDPNPLYQQIFDQVRQGIERGDYPAGTKLPSIRGLADTLQCARNTRWDAAYSMLVSEGFAVSRPGSGYLRLERRAAPRRPAPLRASRRPRESGTAAGCDGGAPVRLHLRGPGTRNLPCGSLALHQRRHTHERGERRLQHLRQPPRRGSAAGPDRLAACHPAVHGLRPLVHRGSRAGTADSVANLLALFDRAGDVVAMEEPGYSGVRAAVERAGFAVAPCRIAGGYEHFMDDLEESGAKLVYVTPSSQFPHLLGHACEAACPADSVGRSQRRLHP